MFDFDAGKLLIIGVIALIVIGPKELPRVLRQVGQAVGRMRRMATEFQGQFMDAMKEADIQGIREEVEKLSRDSQLDTHFDPVRDIQNEMIRTVDASSSVASSTALEAGPPVTLPTDAFTMPTHSIEAPPSADEVAEGHAEPLSLTTDGVASAVPTAVDDGSIAPSFADQPVPSSRKRKILLPKRQPLRSNVRHEVWNRTIRRSRAAGFSRQGAIQA